MKNISYCNTTSEFDIDHEITKHCDKVKLLSKDIDDSYSEKNSKAIKKAIIETLLNSL